MIEGCKMFVIHQRLRKKMRSMSGQEGKYRKSSISSATVDACRVYCVLSPCSLCGHSLCVSIYYQLENCAKQPKQATELPQRRYWESLVLYNTTHHKQNTQYVSTYISINYHSNKYYVCLIKWMRAKQQF